MKRFDVGDGYVQFAEGNRILAEVYALATNNLWRTRIPGVEDEDFTSKEDAVKKVEAHFNI